MKFALIGAGGHAKSVVDILLALLLELDCYVSPRSEAWLNVRHLVDESPLAGTGLAVAMGLGGVEPAQLERRLVLLDGLLRSGLAAPPLVHPSATISPSATLGAGVIVMPGAIVNANARLDRGVIVNSRAVVEHDAEIGAGSHVAPGAIVLGAARLGQSCMIGASAVILQSAAVPDQGFVRAVSLYRGDASNTERQRHEVR